MGAVLGHVLLELRGEALANTLKWIQGVMKVNGSYLMNHHRIDIAMYVLMALPDRSTQAKTALDLLSKALAKEKSVYRSAIEAVRAMLPPAQPGDIAAAIRLAQTGPPVEQVGLEPFGLVDTTGGRR